MTQYKVIINIWNDIFTPIVLANGYVINFNTLNNRVKICSIEINEYDDEPNTVYYAEPNYNLPFFWEFQWIDKNSLYNKTYHMTEGDFKEWLKLFSSEKNFRFCFMFRPERKNSLYGIFTVTLYHSYYILHHSEEGYYNYSVRISSDIFRKMICPINDLLKTIYKIE